MNETSMTMGANPMLEELQNFLNENFDFRYNVLTDMPECKPKNKTETLYALGHNLETVWSWDKTTLWHECSRCGHKADHADHLLSWHVIKKPTVSETGIKQQICEVCGYVAAEEILPKAPLDDVPHTGDITGQIAFAGFSAMMVLSAGLWLVLKRKAAK